MKSEILQVSDFTWQQDPAMKFTWQQDPAMKFTWQQDPAMKFTWQQGPAMKFTWQQGPAMELNSIVSFALVGSLKKLTLFSTHAVFPTIVYFTWIYRSFSTLCMPSVTQGWTRL